MIKLKNLWKIALTAVAMSAMLVACEPEKEKDDNPSNNGGGSDLVFVDYPDEAKISESGVYTAKLSKSGISTDVWGADKEKGKETIKLVLAPKDVVQKIIDESIADDKALFTDGNKCYVYANNDVNNGNFTSATVTEGKYVQPAGLEKEYTGLVITKDGDGNYIVKVDMGNIDTSILLAKGAEESKEDTWGAYGKLKTEYVPMVLGSVTAANMDAPIYPFGIWDAGIAVMVPSTEAYPTEITKEPVMKYTLADVNSYAGTMTVDGGNWSHKKLTDNSFTFKATGTDEFAFTVGNWNYKLGGATIAALDNEYELTVGGENNKFAESVLTAESEYTATLIVKDDKAYVKVTAK